MATFNFYETSPFIKGKFSFLITDYGFEVIETRQENYGFVLVLIKDNRKVHLYYDYRDNFFYFMLINGKNIPYPNDIDTENIKSFSSLFEKHELNFDPRSLQPTEEDYNFALNKNVELLKKYGDKVLNGEEWI